MGTFETNLNLPVKLMKCVSYNVNLFINTDSF